MHKLVQCFDRTATMYRGGAPDQSLMDGLLSALYLLKQILDMLTKLKHEISFQNLDAERLSSKLRALRQSDQQCRLPKICKKHCASGILFPGPPESTEPLEPTVLGMLAKT